MTPTEQRMEMPESLDEEYYQVNPDILQSFNKYRPPLNIYKLKEDVVRLIPFFKVGGRLSNEQVEELWDLAKEGLIFFSRADHSVYVKHISHQLDLVLVDKNLKSAEISDIFMSALTMRLEAFLEQPVRVVWEKLHNDLMVLTEYLWADIHRIRGLFKRLKLGEHNLVDHSVNTGVVGLALYGFKRHKDFEAGGVKRKELDHLAEGLFIHDVGMGKLPLFLREKDKPLTGDEWNKIQTHPKMGYQNISKLDLKYPEIEACVLLHHERMDGSGYPGKVSGDDIPDAAKLCAVADSLSAMLVKRPHAEAMGLNQAAKALADDKRYDHRWTKVLQTLLYFYKQQNMLPDTGE